MPADTAVVLSSRRDVGSCSTCVSVSSSFSITSSFCRCSSLSFWVPLGVFKGGDLSKDTPVRYSVSGGRTRP